MLDCFFAWLSRFQWLSGKVSTDAGDTGDMGSTPGSGRSHGERSLNCSRVLEWKIQWTEEPGRLHGVAWRKTRSSDSIATTKCFFRGCWNVDNLLTTEMILWSFISSSVSLTNGAWCKLMMGNVKQMINLPFGIETVDCYDVWCPLTVSLVGRYFGCIQFGAILKW